MPTIDELHSYLETTKDSLAAAKVRKLKLAIDIRATNSRADRGDKKSATMLPALNKESESVCRAVSALEMEVKDAERRLGLGRAQADARMRKSAAPSEMSGA